MTHEPDKEALSAYLDGEVTPAERGTVEAHLRSCPACARYLQRIQGASADFKQHGAKELPRRLVPGPRPIERARRVAVLLAVGAGVGVVVGSVMLKRFMPGLFQQIQGMISGAANDLGK
jgi:anti-sigma factor RsiW